MSNSRWDDHSGQSRDKARNLRTVAVGVTPLTPSEREPHFEELFVRNYDHFAGRCREFDKPGVAMIAIDTVGKDMAGMALIGANPHKPAAAIIGRHGQADLYLEGDVALSLRHLAVVVEPVQVWKKGSTRLGFRLFDLRTGVAFADESGRVLRGLRSEGPALIRCGRFIVYFLITGDSTDWPVSAEAAWSFLPERVYLEERQTFAVGSERVDPPLSRDSFDVGSPGRSRVTYVERNRGPWSMDKSLCPDGERKVGTLEIETVNGRRAMAVGESAAVQGILLGRYTRCDQSKFLDNDRISRVHALIVDVEEQIYVIDAASSNGTWRVLEGGELEQHRIHVLEQGQVVSLAGRADVSWRWTQ